MRPPPEYSYGALITLVLLWDILLASQIARLRVESRVLLVITSLCGLLLAPGLVVAVASSSILSGRAIHIIAWLWPLTTALFVAQVALALSFGVVRPVLGVPILVLDLLLMGSAVARYASLFIPDLPAPLSAFGAAQAGVLGFVFGRHVLVTPFAVAIPILAPAYPARWRLARLGRTFVGTLAAIVALLLIAEYPKSLHGAQSFRALSSDRVQERPEGDFLIGVRILPTLGAPPTPLTLRNDLSLADTLGADAVSVVLNPSGTTQYTLDSLSRALDDLRSDSTLLVVAVGYDADDGARFRQDPEGYARRRLGVVDRVVRRLRPDILLPLLNPGLEGRAALGDVPLDWWRNVLANAAALSHQLRPRTRVGVAASAFTPPDSALYAWAASRSSPIDVVGFSFYPSYGGGASLDARFRAAEHLMRDGSKPNWVFAVGVNPRVFGERNQERAVWGALTWATNQRRVQGLVVDGAGDYDVLLGLRAPGGRLRPVVATIERARRALAEAVVIRP